LRQYANQANRNRGNQRYYEGNAEDIFGQGTSAGDFSSFFETFFGGGGNSFQGRTG
jgi:hypothetical protein